MDLSRSAELLQDWAGEALTGYPDALVPLPMDAQLSVEAVGPVECLTYTINGVPAADWTASQRYELRLTLRGDESPETLQRLPWHLRKIAEADATLGGRVERGVVELDETDREDHDLVHPLRVPDGWLVRVPLTLEMDLVAQT